MAALLSKNSVSIKSAYKISMHSLCLLFRTEGAVRCYCGFFIAKKRRESSLSVFADVPGRQIPRSSYRFFPFFYIDRSQSSFRCFSQNADEQNPVFFSFLPFRIPFLCTACKKIISASLFSGSLPTRFFGLLELLFHPTTMRRFYIYEEKSNW